MGDPRFAKVKVQNTLSLEVDIALSHMFQGKLDTVIWRGIGVGQTTPTALVCNFTQGGVGVSDYWWVGVRFTELQKDNPDGIFTASTAGDFGKPTISLELSSAKDHDQELVFVLDAEKITLNRTKNDSLTAKFQPRDIRAMFGESTCPVKHVFVLALENRSFDHMLGFSGIRGRDAKTGVPAAIVGLIQDENPWRDELYKSQGLTGEHFNEWRGEKYPPVKGAPPSMPVDPGHEFEDTFQELLGQEYKAADQGKPYSHPNNGGFLAAYAREIAHFNEKLEAKRAGVEGKLMNAVAPVPSVSVEQAPLIMQCYAPEQVPVLVELAKQYAVCDFWFSSMPGPTWPNRMFMLAASSGGLDCSPEGKEIGNLYTVGMAFEHGTILNKLTERGCTWRIYHSGPPIALGIEGVAIKDLWSYDEYTSKSPLQEQYLGFAKALHTEEYKQVSFTFIEPNYGDAIGGTFQGGTSQHPLDDVAGGEKLIKEVYESIRNSPLWKDSLLIVTWDEHGGFYDHFPPPEAVSPGDVNIMDNPPKKSSTWWDTLLFINSMVSGTGAFKMTGDLALAATKPKVNKNGFDFKRYGVRVPAVVVSPYIPQGTIDHSVYDHASIPKTLEELFGLPHLTERDKHASSVLHLLSLKEPRVNDAPTKLPDPPPRGKSAGPQADPNEPIDGNAAGIVGAMLNQDLEMCQNDEERIQVIRRANQIKTRGQAQEYADDFKRRHPY
jgi:phospholipase C